MQGEGDYCGFQWTGSGQHRTKIVSEGFQNKCFYIYSIVQKNWDCSFHFGIIIKKHFVVMKLKDAASHCQ